MGSPQVYVETKVLQKQGINEEFAREFVAVCSKGDSGCGYLGMLLSINSFAPLY
jgi:hypothetical protein